MTSEEMKAWRTEMGYTQAGAARALHISGETYRAYEKGVWAKGNAAEIPGTIADLCDHMLTVRRLAKRTDERARRI